MMYDFIVIGSGYGGLSAAALLAKEGYKVLILEAHTEVAGCGSYFKRKEFLFDVGATTFSGVLPHQPLGFLFDKLDIDPPLKKMDPGLIIKNINGDIYRHADKEKWIEETIKIFDSSKQRKFWEKVFEIDSIAWELNKNNYKLPPTNFYDYLSAVKLSNIKGLKLLPHLHRSVDTAVKEFGLNDNITFRKFLDEQLFITTQNNRYDAPFLTASMGLAYPSETYYPVGGMYKPAELIRNKFIELDGEILFKHQVTKIEKLENGYKLVTKKGNEFIAKSVISNIPIWNMKEITEGNIQKYFSRQSKIFNNAWGAFTLNFAIESNEEMPTAYYQVHTKNKIPFCDASSFFVTISQKGDLERAPKGWKTITISTHTNVNNWLKLSKEEYTKRKETATQFILDEFEESFPEFRDSEKAYILAGTPETFEFFTKRYKGFVGGIPHSIKKSILKMPPNTTPFKDLFMVGDTVFPGQGTPAVVLSAINVYKRITS